MRVYFEGATELVFTENETNAPRSHGAEGSGYYKDAFHDYVVGGQGSAVNPAGRGTKAAAVYRLTIPARSSVTLRARFGGIPRNVC